jgi:two-component system, OmpR family, phosphate regulon sensor histidine kinase PhoR
MRNVDGHLGTSESRNAFNVSGAAARPVTWRMTAVAEPQKFSDFEALLLAIAGHDLRQPLQTIQSAHELLGIGVRTQSELRQLASSQIAVGRLTQQLDQLIGALRLRGHATAMTLSAIRLVPLLRQACYENEEAALQKGIEIRIVSTSASVVSDVLLLGTVLRNLISNAVKYTRPGGRILVGCRRADPDIRIDVLDTGSGIAEEAMPKIFDAITRLDHERCDGLGIGLFIVRQALGLLGHRVDVSSVTCRGSRFSIFAAGAEKAPL